MREGGGKLCPNDREQQFVAFVRAREEFEGRLLLSAAWNGEVYVVYSGDSPWMVYFKENNLWVISKNCETWVQFLTGNILMAQNYDDIARITRKGLNEVVKMRLEGRFV